MPKRMKRGKIRKYLVTTGSLRGHDARTFEFSTPRGVLDYIRQVKGANPSGNFRITVKKVYK